MIFHVLNVVVVRFLVHQPKKSLRQILIMFSLTYTSDGEAKNICIASTTLA